MGEGGPRSGSDEGDGLSARKQAIERGAGSQLPLIRPPSAATFSRKGEKDESPDLNYRATLTGGGAAKGLMFRCW